MVHNIIQQYYYKIAFRLWGDPNIAKGGEGTVEKGS
jgi:hypothetical protein